MVAVLGIKKLKLKQIAPFINPDLKSSGALEVRS